MNCRRTSLAPCSGASPAPGVFRSSTLLSWRCSQTDIDQTWPFSHLSEPLHLFWRPHAWTGLLLGVVELQAWARPGGYRPGSTPPGALPAPWCSLLSQPLVDHAGRPSACGRSCCMPCEDAVPKGNFLVIFLCDIFHLFNLKHFYFFQTSLTFCFCTGKRTIKLKKTKILETS